MEADVSDMLCMIFRIFLLLMYMFMNVIIGLLKILCCSYSEIHISKDVLRFTKYHYFKRALRKKIRSKIGKKTKQNNKFYSFYEDIAGDGQLKIDMTLVEMLRLYKDNEIELIENLKLFLYKCKHEKARIKISRFLLLIEMQYKRKQLNVEKKDQWAIFRIFASVGKISLELFNLLYYGVNSKDDLKYEKSDAMGSVNNAIEIERRKYILYSELNREYLNCSKLDNTIEIDPEDMINSSVLLTYFYMYAKNNSQEFSEYMKEWEYSEPAWWGSSQNWCPSVFLNLVLGEKFSKKTLFMLARKLQKDVVFQNKYNKHKRRKLIHDGKLSMGVIEYILNNNGYQCYHVKSMNDIKCFTLYGMYDEDHIMIGIKVGETMYVINDCKLNHYVLTNVELKRIIDNKQLIALEKNEAKKFSIYNYWIFPTYVGGRRKKMKKNKKNEEDEEYKILSKSMKRKEKRKRKKKRDKKLEYERNIKMKLLRKQKFKKDKTEDSEYILKRNRNNKKRRNKKRRNKKRKKRNENGDNITKRVEKYRKGDRKNHARMDLFEMIHEDESIMDRCRKYTCGILGEMKKDGETYDLYCEFCGAMYYKDEVNSKGDYTNCCMNGKICQVTIDELMEKNTDLKKLFVEDNLLGKEFLDYILSYNNAYAFSCFRAKGGYEKYWCTVKIKGKVYHQMKAIVNEEDDDAEFVQIYFLGEDEATIRRKEKLIKFTKEKISTGREKRMEKILDILTSETEDNKLLDTYEKALEVAEENGSEDVKIIWCAKERGAHHVKQYKERDDCLPAIITTENYEKKGAREIVLFLKKKALEDYGENDGGNNVSFINEFHRIYDCSHYVLFFPGGQSSFGFYLPKINGKNKKFKFKKPSKAGKKRKKRSKQSKVIETDNEKDNFVTCREFYRYQFQQRVSPYCNILLRGRKLMMQYACDMCAKMEVIFVTSKC